MGKEVLAWLFSEQGLFHGPMGKEEEDLKDALMQKPTIHFLEVEPLFNAAARLAVAALQAKETTTHAPLAVLLGFLERWKRKREEGGGYEDEPPEPEIEEGVEDELDNNNNEDIPDPLDTEDKGEQEPVERPRKISNMNAPVMVELEGETDPLEFQIGSSAIFGHLCERSKNAMLIDHVKAGCVDACNLPLLSVSHLCPCSALSTPDPLAYEKRDFSYLLYQTPLRHVPKGKNLVAGVAARACPGVLGQVSSRGFEFLDEL
ncbi:hypothetical protein NL676_016401 [Syzygium grande]|nr:hypothetical protein NL676_016401 [Syzygium grande]